MIHVTSVPHVQLEDLADGQLWLYVGRLALPAPLTGHRAGSPGRYPVDKHGARTRREQAAVALRVLPAPFLPSRPKISPRLMPLTALTGP